MMEQPVSQNQPLIQPIVEPFQRFLHAQSTGGVLLLAATIAAMVWANSPCAESAGG
jgi:NhaA family Na+:H+ antiporter